MSSKIRICAIALLLNVMWFLSTGLSAPKGLGPAGKVVLKTAGPLCFGPEGVLFVGDPQAATIYAIDTGEQSSSKSRTPVNVPQLDAKLASLLGSSADQILINDLAVHPGTGTIYISLSRGKGNDAKAVIARVAGSGEVSELSLDKVANSQYMLVNPPGPDAKDRRGRSQRQESITDLAYFDGKLFMAGLSNEEFASKLRAVSFPFGNMPDAGTSVEVYHGAHGAFETRSPVRTFAPFNINGEPHLLAAYTCTPLVKFPVAQLAPGSKITGTTVAELGNMNQPLDMVVYEKDGKSWLLLANSRRGVMKISTENIERQEGITEPVKNEKAGQTYETVAELKDVQHLDKSGDEHCVLLVKSEKGIDLQTVALP